MVGQWQGHSEESAAASGRSRGDLAAVSLDQLPHNCQTDARAAGAHAAASIETLKHTLELGRRNPRTGVRDLEHGLVSLAPDRDPHFAALRRELERVGEEVANHLPQASRITVDQRRLGTYHEPHRTFRKKGCEFSGYRTGLSSEIDLA